MSEVLEKHVTSMIYKEKKIRNGLFDVLYLIFLTSFFIRYALMIEVPVMFFLFLCFIMALIADYNELLALTVSFIPLSTLFQYKYGILIVLCILILRYFHHIKLNKAFVSFILLAAWELLHALVGVFSISDFLRSMTELFFISMIFFCPMLRPKAETDYVQIVRKLAWATITLCIIILYINITENGVNVILSTTGKTRFGFVGRYFDDINSTINPNILGGICAFSISTIFQIIIYKKDCVFDYISIILLYFFILLTQSKMAIISGLFLLCLIVFLSKGPKATLKTLVLVILLLVIVYGLIYRYYPSVIDLIKSRFLAEDLSNGRIKLINDYNNLFLTNYSISLFGVGLQDFFSKLVYDLGMMNVPHNALQEMIAIWGIEGILFFSIFTYLLYQKIGKKPDKINFFPVIQLILVSLNDQFVTNGKLLLMFFLCFISLSIDFSKEKVISVNEKLTQDQQIRRGYSDGKMLE